MQADSSMPLPLLRISRFLKHFQALMGPYGLYQHATVREPLLKEGYCTDDNARAVTMLLWLSNLNFSSSDQKTIQALLDRCWQFLLEAEEKPGLFYNFRSADGAWLPQDRSEDMYARVIRSLVTVLNIDTDLKRQAQADRLLVDVLKHVPSFKAPRAWAEILVALPMLTPAQQDRYAVQPLMEQGSSLLRQLWKENSAPAWPWFESAMTYANALLPHGLLVSMKFLPSPEAETIVRQSAAFLLATTIKNGVFVPIGSRGWYPQGGVPSTDNQQAIEAALMFDFLLEYTGTFPEASASLLAAPYMWFFGRNTGNTVLADEQTGSCLDGLFITGLNSNYGAESMLAYQWVEIQARLAPLPIQSLLSREKAKG